MLSLFPKYVHTYLSTVTRRLYTYLDTYIYVHIAAFGGENLHYVDYIIKKKFTVKQNYVCTITTYICKVILWTHVLVF